jgi:hypothetical protein
MRKLNRSWEFYGLLDSLGRYTGLNNRSTTCDEVLQHLARASPRDGDSEPLLMQVVIGHGPLAS